MNNSPKFAFVILHYNTIEDTVLCVESIQEKCEELDYHIYIVDNASPNESGAVVERKYAENSKVTVILSDRNLGFAKGNNLGIAQARQDCFDDFVVVMNSDVKIIQNDFCKKIIESYMKEEFAVLGPTIYTPKGRTSINPGRTHILKGAELESWEKFYKKSLCFIKKKKNMKLKMLRSVMNFRLRLRSAGKPRFQYTRNCVLHGCCLIFSKKFFEKFDGFDSRTFLYFEEEILYAHMMKVGLKTVYDPSVEIWHKEDGATNSIYEDNLKKTVFVYENTLESILIYREIIGDK